jgi:hypothetical protein
MTCWKFVKAEPSRALCRFASTDVARRGAPERKRPRGMPSSMNQASLALLVLGLLSCGAPLPSMKASAFVQGAPSFSRLPCRRSRLLAFGVKTKAEDAKSKVESALLKTKEAVPSTTLLPEALDQGAPTASSLVRSFTKLLVMSVADMMVG